MAGLCLLLAPTATFSLNVDEAAVKRGHERLKYFVVFNIFFAVASVLLLLPFPPTFFPLKVP